jgi:hypothetical protein
MSRYGKNDKSADGNQSQMSAKEVRAGPGDAGKQDKPNRLPEPPGDREQGQQAIVLLAALTFIGTATLIVLQLAA